MNDLGNVPMFLTRAAQQLGLNRERYTENNVPTVFDKIVIMPFFGDQRYLAILSALLLHPVLKKHYADKYFILCSWQGCAGLFPYVQEYWSIADSNSLKEMSDKTCGSGNKDVRFETMIRNMNRYFEKVVTWDELAPYYDLGLTKKFLDEFGTNVSCYLPPIPGPKLEFSKELAQRTGKKVLLQPTRVANYWNRKYRSEVVKKDFWVELVKDLLNNGYVPVVYQNYATYDISDRFGNDCLYVTDFSVLSVMAAMRATGCVLDVFNGISRLAMLARCPFVVCDERLRYIHAKEYEVNDLCISCDLPHRYILTFCTMFENGSKDVVGHITSVLSKFFVGFDSSKLPSSTESYTEVPYSVVRTHKAKKLGCDFIRVERLLI